jgi:uncharacterized membrane protein
VKLTKIWAFNTRREIDMRKSIFSGLALVFVSAAPVFADSVDGYADMMGGYGIAGFGMLLGPIFMLVVLAGLVVGIVALIRLMVPGSGFSGIKENNALNALNLQFANGEIADEEYATRKKLLLG